MSDRAPPLAVAGALAALLAVALLARLAFFIGFMGSDEIVYTGGAVAMLHGEVVRTDYIGSLRYGIDIPVAFFIWLLGPSVVAASMWGMLASLADVALVFGCAYLLWGRRAAIFAGLTIAFLPLHVNLAGRMLADPPLVAFMTLSFFCFLLGSRRDAAGWFFVAGLAVGASFWVKQAAILYVLAFPLIALVGWFWNWKWLWAAGGALLMLLANCIVMWQFQGDPFHVFRVSGEGVSDYGARVDIDDAAWLYFEYLFLDIRHTWLLSFLALLGTWYGLKRSRPRGEEHPLLYAGVWAASLILIFSFTVISLDPLRFVMKQSNYMLLFTAPLCLLAGYGLASLRLRYATALASLYAAGGLGLAGLAQQDIHVFRANSVPAVLYAHQNPQVDVFATTNAYRLALFEKTLSSDRSSKPALKHLSELSAVRWDASGSGEPTKPRIAVVDTQNMHWGRNPFNSIDEVPGCWKRIGQLQSAPVRSAGHYVVEVISSVSTLLPARLAVPSHRRLAALSEPKPAYLFEVPLDCDLPAMR